MACGKCGGSRKKGAKVYPEFQIATSVMGDEFVRIGAKSSILLDGLAADKVFLEVGKVIKVDNAAAIDLQKQGAPIWILT